MSEEQNKIVVFQETEIRRVWHKDEWWFSVIDVIEVLSESQNPRRYWSDLKIKLKKEGAAQLYEKIVQLKLEAADGKLYNTDCANTETMFRIIQSIPSPKAEPFKLWLAQVGYERIQEIENPELAAQRARQYYKDLGYSEVWIETRLKSVETREQLTDEWKARNVKEGMEYAILTAEISKATFGLTPSEYMKYKDLKRENLRDHMTDIELIFTMLGEATTRNKAVEKDAQGFEENRGAAREGGRAAGKALDAYEKEAGSKVVTDTNFKQQIAAAKQQKKLERKKKDKEK
ncbi:MAG: Bro-N domain-containing protein [Saprospiraceae bacterium]|jgi:DNA-damage-inducible protein D|nr:Bro-N domain-containing protein [Saprospiraceae bacterium]